MTTTAEPDTEARAPIDAYVVALDETWGWVIDKADAPFIKAIRTVYLFDRNERVHCCELTPSFYEMHLYHEVECQPGTSEERAQRIYEKYESQPGDNFYVHCHELETIIEAGKPFTVHHYGDTGVSYDDVSRDDQLEALCEHFNANHPL